MNSELILKASKDQKKDSERLRAKFAYFSTSAHGRMVLWNAYLGARTSLGNTGKQVVLSSEDF